MSDRAEERWDEIRARSERGGCYCATCYYNFYFGVRHPDGGGYPCSKHATTEERNAVNDAIAKLLPSLNHPLLNLVKR